jgi:hypothetical protein
MAARPPRHRSPPRAMIRRTSSSRRRAHRASNYSTRTPAHRIAQAHRTARDRLRVTLHLTSLMCVRLRVPVVDRSHSAQLLERELDHDEKREELLDELQSHENGYYHFEVRHAGRLASTGVRGRGEWTHACRMLMLGRDWLVVCRAQKNRLQLRRTVPIPQAIIDQYDRQSTLRHLTPTRTKSRWTPCARAGS